MDYIDKTSLVARFDKILGTMPDDLDLDKSVRYLDELIDDNETVKFIELECVMKEFGFNIDWEKTASYNGGYTTKSDGLSIIYTNAKGDEFFLDVGVKLNINFFHLYAKGTFFESGEREEAIKAKKENK